MNLDPQSEEALSHLTAGGALLAALFIVLAVVVPAVLG